MPVTAMRATTPTRPATFELKGNPRVDKALKTEFATVLAELKRIEAGKGVDDELLSVIELKCS